MSRICLFLLLLVSASAQAEFSRTYLDEHPLEVANANGISIAYRELSPDQQPAVVMIMGLGASHAVWGDGMAKGLQEYGYRVILLDNRDTGGSTRFDDWGQPTIWWQFLKNTLGFSVDAPFTLHDMAADTAGLMDALDVEDAHIVGASMGGMIAQVFAAQYPERTRSLVSIMSTTGARHLPPPSSEASNSLIGTASGDDETAERRRQMVARGFYPESMGRQLMAIFKAGDRSEEVMTISAPTLVLHGADDTLVPPEHGAHTAELIQGSEHVVYEGMGHNIPEEVRPALLAKMNEHMRAVDSTQGAL